MRLLFKLFAGVIPPPLLVGKPWGSIDLRLIALSLGLILSGCVDEHGRVSSGIHIEITYQWCSNPETLQSRYVIGECTDGWRFGSYNDCTNITTEMLEVTLMEAPELCPEGFTGGAIHDECKIGDFPFSTAPDCL